MTDDKRDAQRRRNMNARKREKVGGSDQGSLFGGSAEGRQRAEQGGQLAEEKAERILDGYRLMAEAGIIALLRTPGAIITGEDLRAIVPTPEGADPRCSGPCFTRLARCGVIQAHELPGRSENPNGNARYVTRWVRGPKYPAAAAPPAPGPFPSVDDLVRDDMPPADGVSS